MTGMTRLSTPAVNGSSSAEQILRSGRPLQGCGSPTRGCSTEGKQPRSVSGNGADDLFFSRIFKGCPGLSTADGKIPGDRSVVAPGGGGENPEVFLPNVRSFGHMSGILDDARHQGFDR